MVNQAQVFASPSPNIGTNKFQVLYHLDFPMMSRLTFGMCGSYFVIMIKCFVDFIFCGGQSSYSRVPFFLSQTVSGVARRCSSHPHICRNRLSTLNPLQKSHTNSKILNSISGWPCCSSLRRCYLPFVRAYGQYLAGIHRYHDK